MLEGGWVGRWVWIEAGCPCPHVRNEIVTPRHLFSTVIEAQTTEDNQLGLRFGDSPTEKTVE